MSNESKQEDVSGPHEYTMGHSKATTATHEARTIESDASFLIPHIAKHHAILDVGCGPGTITTGFASIVSGQVIGIDYSQEVIERARALASSRGVAHKVKFMQGNLLTRLPFEDESFDIVFASQVFGHLQPSENAIKALVECRRVLKPNGILALRDAAKMTWYPFTEELDRVFTQRLWRGVGADNFGGLDTKGWLREAGFDVENQGKVKIAGGSEVDATRERCQWRCDSFVGRLAKGEQFRESWLKVGITEEECEETIEWLKKWAASDDAFYGMLQTETLAWK